MTIHFTDDVDDECFDAIVDAVTTRLVRSASFHNLHVHHPWETTGPATGVRPELTVTSHDRLPS
jgi:hypothetical protein